MKLLKKWKKEIDTIGFKNWWFYVVSCGRQSSFDYNELLRSVNYDYYKAQQYKSKAKQIHRILEKVDG